MPDPVFDCTMCGSCCEGKGGIVVSKSDLQRLAACLQLSDEEIIARYGEYAGTKLKIRSNEDGFCVFFVKDKGCSVHAGKPSICRAWPFFRGNLLDKESFAMAKDFCPGIKREATHEAFVREGLLYLRTESLLAHDPQREANALILD